MKIAIISDIHGNKLAFDTVLDDIKIMTVIKFSALETLQWQDMTRIIPLKNAWNFKTTMGRNFEIIQGNTDKLIAHYSETKFLEVNKNHPQWHISG